jgi:hypothetical protein
MSTYELLQWLGLGAGALVLVAIVVGAIKLSRATDAVWPNCATKYGLTFDQQNEGNALTAQRHVKSLTGAVQNVPLRVISTWKMVGNTRTTSTALYARSLYPAPQRFSLQVHRGASRPQYHVVPTGDPNFDRQISLRSDSPALTRALMNPAVQAALLRLPMTEVGLAYDHGELCLSYGGQPFKAAELEAPIEAIVVMGHSRLA